MTRVQWTVTKDFDDLPKELEKVLEEASSTLDEVSKTIKKTREALPLGLPMGSVLKQVESQTKVVENLWELMKDITNICLSLSNLDKEKEKEALKKRVEENLTQIQKDTDIRIGQYAANQRLYTEQVEMLKEEANNLRKQIEKLTAAAPQKKKKTTKGK